MNPYPFSISSFWSQLLIGVVFVYLVLALAAYSVLSIRSRYFVAVPARLLEGASQPSNRKLVYKYTVEGKEYF
ncbi:MAG: hypothetical protein ACJATD_000237 [Alloalcanivorax sp.]|jgi:hypothetical protein